MTLRHHLLARGELLALALAALCLLAALFAPSLPGERHLFEHVVVLDITQSMDVRDIPVAEGRPQSRLAAAKAALHRGLLALPCGSRVGLGVFTEHRTLLLLTPMEVCEHMAELRATLARIDGRMAWAGDSEVAKGLHAGLRQLAQLPGRPSLLFVTDGHEAPPLDARQRPRFDGTPGDIAGVLVGVGGRALQPIPRSDPSGRPIGTWGADDVMQVDPYSQGRGASVAGETMTAPALVQPAPGATPGREHLSSLREGYLRLLAGETGLDYAELAADDGLAPLLTRASLARPVASRVELAGPLAGLALALLLGLWLRPWWRHAAARRTSAQPAAAGGITAAAAPGTTR
jgi:mxaL protein